MDYLDKLRGEENRWNMRIDAIIDEIDEYKRYSAILESYKYRIVRSLAGTE